MSKILYVASNMQHINNFHIPYISRLREDGHTVRVMASGAGADIDIPFVKRMLSLKNLITQRRIRRIVKREGFDAIILNTTLAAFHVRMALPKKDRPKIINIVHGYLFHDEATSLKKKILLFCEKILREKTDAIAVMNAEDKKIAEENSLCLGEVIMTRGMGVKLADRISTAESIRRFTGTEDKFLLGFVGELSERKNQRFLICSLPEIKIAEPNAELMLIGLGAEEHSLRALADKLGVSSSVHFVGYKSNPCDFMRACDLYVSASDIEGMPFNIIEALGCRVPVLASEVKGHKDIITDGAEGYLYRKDNMADFIARVKAFIKSDITVDPDAQSEMFNKYSFDSVFDETYGVMRDFVK